MPVEKYKWVGKLPYHSSHKLNGEWVDICLGDGDTVELSEAAVKEPAIQNLIKTGYLVKEEKKQPAKEKQA